MQPKAQLADVLPILQSIALQATALAKYVEEESKIQTPEERRLQLQTQRDLLTRQASNIDPFSGDNETRRALLEEVAQLNTEIQKLNHETAT